MNDQEGHIHFTGKLNTIIHRNDDFLIGILHTNQGDIKVKGSMYGVEKEEKIKVQGVWESHPTFGKQFSVQSWERPIPQTKDQVIAFLASPLIKGCGPKMAVLIADRLGENALTRISNEGEVCLDGIRGIGKKTANKIVESVRASFEIQNIISQLRVFGITANMAMKLYKEYGSNTIGVITKNPYKLVELNGIGFLKADEIARKIGILPTSSFRIDACLKYVLKKLCFDSGHCYVSEEELFTETELALNHHSVGTEQVTIEELTQCIHRLDEHYIVIEDGRVYPKFLFMYEDRLARKLSEMGGSRGGEAMPILDNHIKQYQKKHGIVLAEKQREAIRRLFDEQLLVLTGGPGTGKTTVVRAMLDIYKEMYPKHNISLCAPTGRASRKLSEVAGREAVTIHRLIGYRQGEVPEFNWENTLSCKLLIVDEMSMVDVQLASLLMDALERNTKVLFVGDIDQLPSVAPGNVLADLIQSGIPTVTLTEVFRQAQESQIVSNAHRINKGQPLLIDNNKKDFYFINKQEPKDIASLIVKSALRFTTLGYDLSDILILSPMKKGPVGNVVLNEMLRDALNPAHLSKKEWKIGERHFREGDKILQTKNNSSKDVFNGDIGIIKKITKISNDDNELVEVMICDYSGRKVTYKKEELKQIELGYAITIHKSQGGESPIVIIPTTTSHYVMLARNLMYTGITRAKEIMVLIGTKKAMNIAIKNNKIAQRNSRLSERIINYKTYNNRYKEVNHS